MARNVLATVPASLVGDTQSPLRRVAAQYAESRIAMLALATLLVVAVIAVTAPLIAPQNPYDLRAIDIEDGRLPPGSPKLSRQVDIGMTVTLGRRSAGESANYDVEPRGRAGDAPVDALDLHIAALPDDTTRRFEMTLLAAPGGPLEPLRKAQTAGIAARHGAVRGCEGQVPQRLEARRRGTPGSGDHTAGLGRRRTFDSP